RVGQDLLDIVVRHAAEKGGVAFVELKADVDPLQQIAFATLFDALRDARLLVPAEGEEPDESREGIFYWSHDTRLETAAAAIADVELAVFGVNHVALPLLGNLRSVGFRNVRFIDHPALRNPDFYVDGAMRPEIASALASNRPTDWETW